MTCPAIGTEHECPKIGTEKECLIGIDGQLCSSIKEVSLKEVDIYLLGEVPGKVQDLAPRMKRIIGRVRCRQTHTYAVGDKYELLPEDKDPDIDDWKISDIRGHIRESKEVR